MLLLARLLGPVGQGKLAAFQAGGQICSTLIWFGIPGSVVYFVGRNRNSVRSVLHTSAFWLVISYFLFAAVLFGLPIEELAAQAAAIQPYMFLFALFVLVLAIFVLLQSTALGLQDYFTYNMMTLIPALALLGLALYQPDTTAPDALVNLVMSGYVIAHLFGVVLSGAKIRSTYIGSVESKVRLLSQLWVGWRAFLSSLAGLLLFRVDLFLVGFFLGLEELGVYSIGLFAAELVTKIPHWSASILTPVVASGDTESVKKTLYLFFSSLLFAMLAAVILLSVLLLFPGLLGAITGAEFQGSQVCLLLLLPRVVMQSGVSVLASNLAGKGYPWYHPGGNILALLCLLVLDLLLIPHFGISGAAAANSLSYVACFAVEWLGFSRINNVNISKFADSFRQYVFEGKRALLSFYNSRFQSCYGR